MENYSYHLVSYELVKNLPSVNQYVEARRVILAFLNYGAIYYMNPLIFYILNY